MAVAGSHEGYRLPGKDYYFYHGLDYGSESLVNPLRLIITGGFGILQMDNRSNHLDDVDFSNGYNNVMENLTHPFKAIDEEGLSEFLLNQVVPVSFNREKAYYWPNYTLHLIGGGMSYRMMLEWFRLKGYRNPAFNSAVTITLYHFLNEVVENSRYTGYNTDPIADLYIFDPLGIVLFSSERVSRFFGKTLNMADWSYQVCYNPVRNSVQNVGQNFAMKYWINDDRDIGLFYHFGTHGELGLSFRTSDGGCLSFGAGLVANELVDISEKTTLRELTADLVVTAGLFYDRNNSLLASLLYSKSQDYKVRMNMYPGLFEVVGVAPGLFISLDQDNHLSAGLTLRFIPAGLSHTF
jgi:hypothetical protein